MIAIADAEADRQVHHLVRLDWLDEWTKPDQVDYARRLKTTQPTSSSN
jgi:hypothetical protein